MSRKLSNNRHRQTLSAGSYLISRKAQAETGTGGMGPAGPAIKGKVQYENTYRMEPHAVFDAEHATRLMREILEARLDGVQYDPAICSDLAKSLADEVKEQFKEMKYDRYRFVAMVTIGQFEDCTATVVSRCLMTSGIDTYASVSHHNRDVFAVSTLYAIYKE